MSESETVAPARSATGVRWRLWALVPILLLVGIVSAFFSTDASLTTLVGRNPPPLDQLHIGGSS